MVLQKLALVCRSALRQSDILGRLGGEEFAVLLPETALEEAAEVAERLRATIASMDLRIMGPGSCIRVTISIGVTEFQRNKDVIPSLDAALEQADRALYEAKRRGRNQVVVLAEASATTPAVCTPG